MHGAGNDFVLLDLLRPDPSGLFSNPSAMDDREWGDLARRLCDRHFGIGSDGLLLVLPSSSADARMRMFNPDGSESASCGNGIRCLGRYLRDRHGLGEGGLRVQTGAGSTTITVRPDGSVTVDMGKPIFAPSQIPVAVEGTDALAVSLDLDGRQIPVACVSMGNPHAVTFVEPGSLDDYALEAVGPQVERHTLFPQRTNFEVCEVLAPNHMRIRVWERGAGITLACGTGACASVVVAVTSGRVQSPVLVDLPGGSLMIEWAEGGSVLMTGPTEYVFTGSVPGHAAPPPSVARDMASVAALAPVAAR